MLVLGSIHPKPHLTVGILHINPDSSLKGWPGSLGILEYILLGLYRNNGKENGNYYSIMGYIIGVI